LDSLFHPDAFENVDTLHEIFNERVLSDTEPQDSAESAAEVLADLSTSPTQETA
jgi:hypothetical protein